MASVSSVTTQCGDPALDMTKQCAAAVESAGATLVADSGICTHCSVDHWSWRANRDQGRQATVVWVPPAASANRPWSTGPRPTGRWNRSLSRPVRLHGSPSYPAISGVAETPETSKCLRPRDA